MKNKQQLNTSNPEYITWQYEQLQFALLGGIAIEGLDRMRVTVKVEWKQQAIEHNLDLYNDSGVDKLLKRCAERFCSPMNKEQKVQGSDTTMFSSSAEAK
jgi:hypothetical protein